LGILTPLLSILTLRILKRHIFTPNSLLSHSTSKSVANCGLWPDQRNKQKKQMITKRVYISPTWGEAHLELIATKFGNSLYLTEVINHSTFGVNCYRSFGSGEVQNLPFPIEAITVPYHCCATVLARDYNYIIWLPVFD